MACRKCPGYEIVERIGRAGWESFTRLAKTSLGRFVAVKLLRDDHARATDRLARFLREARTHPALNHPGICTVHALCEHDGRPFIVMELVEGLTLRGLAARLPQARRGARLIGHAAQRWRPPTPPEWSTGTSSPRTSWPAPTACERSSDFGLAAFCLWDFSGNPRGK